MAKLAKFLQGAAGAAGGEGLNVEEVFSTYLYEGQSSTLAVNNGIDLATEDGLTWIKCRNAAEDHFLFSSLQNASNQTLFLKSNTTNAATAINNVSQTSTGFSLPGGDGQTNQTGNDYASWTFRKAPKFFDVVTYTGNGTAGRTISHNLGSVPGCIIVKNLNTVSTDWSTYHRSEGATKYGKLNTTDAFSGAFTGQWNETEPTDSVFTVGDSLFVNQNGDNYVAYLFAHNDGDGDFGPTADQDIIKCGSFDSDASSGTTPVDVDLGFEPQFFMWKPVSGANPSGDWVVYDTMRGFVNATSGNGDARLRWNTSGAEQAYNNTGHPTATGVTMKTGAYGTKYVYIAIRRGPMAVPESATEVFAIDTSTSDSSGDVLASTFPVDAYLYGRRSGASHGLMARLTETRLFTDSTSSEGSLGSYVDFDRQTGVKRNALLGNASTVDYMWKRAPNFFDVVAYTGAGYNTNVKHNLGVTPELCIAKSRTTNSVVDDWYVWCSHSGDGNDTVGFLNSSGTSALGFHASSPSSTDLYLHGNVAYSTYPYVMYLFASLDGVSKVGSYTGDGTTDGSKVIDCGFSSGARFVLIKRTDGGGSWYVWDSERGIVAGNDPRLKLESTDAEDSFDNVDPHSSGFSVVGSSINNINGATYIFYAIA